MFAVRRFSFKRTMMFVLNIYITVYFTCFIRFEPITKLFAPFENITDNALNFLRLFMMFASLVFDFLPDIQNPRVSLKLFTHLPLPFFS